MLFDNGLTRMDRDTEYLVGNLQERYGVGRTRRKQSECLHVRRSTDRLAGTLRNQRRNWTI